MLMSAAQLSSYDQMKQVMLKTKYFKDDLITHFLASFSAGFIATVVTSPIDVAKTRIMNQKPDPVTGQLQYKGVSDCLIRTMKSEGFIGLYKVSSNTNFLYRIRRQDRQNNYASLAI
jgi:solute carrier family 25 oxoglutarate transporter 11